MEKYTTFLDWKNQHCQNDYTIQSNQQIQWNFYQITDNIFSQNYSKKHFTVCMETQKTLKSQDNLEKGKWVSLTSGYTTKLQ